MVTDGFAIGEGGTRIAYRDYRGKGRGLVLLHGIGGNLETMDQYAKRLGAGRRVVSIDLRCCGQSDTAEVVHFEAMAADVEAVAAALSLGEVDVVGHSLGGMVASFYGVAHPTSRIVSIDGFPPGSLTVAGVEDRAEYRRWLERARDQLYVMTEPPESGHLAWREAQLTQVVLWLRATGYTAPNAKAVAHRHFVPRADATFERHPPRHLVDALFGDLELDVLRAYRASNAETLIIRCTEWAPPGIDVDLAELANHRKNVEVVRLPISHLAPAWDALDEVSELIHEHWRRFPPPRVPVPFGHSRTTTGWNAGCSRNHNRKESQ